MQKLSFNDHWTCNGAPVTLPHDAQITEKRSADASNGGHGYYPGGVYTYEKKFSVPAEWKGKTVLVEFEGVYKKCYGQPERKGVDLPSLWLYQLLR